MTGSTVHVLDYGAGNIRSVINAIEALGFKPTFVQSPEQLLDGTVKRLIFPGVGAFGQAMESLDTSGYGDALRTYLKNGNPYLGICIGMQCLFEASEESPKHQGLGIVPGKIIKLRPSPGHPVPHMGWNEVRFLDHDHAAHPAEDGDAASGDMVVNQECVVVDPGDRFYFVHSYAAPLTDANRSYAACVTDYGDEDQQFISVVRHGNITAMQFHPEKSGGLGLSVIGRFLGVAENALPRPARSRQIDVNSWANGASVVAPTEATGVSPTKTVFAKRVIACLDVRTNDQGDLVVTKGDQYDVREKSGENAVRNLGKPVELATRYYNEGADEVTFLNITSFRSIPAKDLPMLDVLRLTSQSVFVPLTIGGGIRSFDDPDGTHHSALDIASLYFRSGADKVSIGSDAVYVAEKYWERRRKAEADGDTAAADALKHDHSIKHSPYGDGTSSIETISAHFGSQAVVISVDPRRVWVNSPSDVPHKCVRPSLVEPSRGPNGEGWCWWQCTVKGGREGRDMGVYELVTAMQDLGAGEILLNCMDKDGTNSGYDLDLLTLAKDAVQIPVIASSGAGKPGHFTEVFQVCNADAALAAGIFHRREVAIEAVKRELVDNGIPVRRTF
eukprot:Clim_evm64s201 gene=Clim_evmTU64s201